MYRCKKCNRMLPDDLFYRDKDGNIKSPCKDCHRKYRNEYRQRPEVKAQRKEYAKKYYIKNREKLKAYIKKYHKEHLERDRNYGIKYRREHPEVHREHKRKRKLKVKRLVEDFTKEEWQQKVDATNGFCVCGRRFSEVRPFVPTHDHTPPVSKVPVGFCYSLNDVTPLCGSCNSSKRDKEN